MIRVAVSILVLALGLTLAGGGIHLARLGGGWGYMVLGALLALSGGLLLAKRGGGLSAYAAALLFALGWGLWQVGLDWWALAPRGGLLVLLGLLLLLPPREPIRRREVVAGDTAAERNRTPQSFEGASIESAGVVSDVFGVSGLPMLRALAEGNSAPCCPQWVHGSGITIRIAAGFVARTGSPWPRHLQRLGPAA